VPLLLPTTVGVHSRPRVAGFEKKINKKRDGGGLWKTVKPGTKGSLPDSYLLYLHRYVLVRLGLRKVPRTTVTLKAVQRLLLQCDVLRQIVYP
jgi:hypothetical protein